MVAPAAVSSTDFRTDFLVPKKGQLRSAALHVKAGLPHWANEPPPSCCTQCHTPSFLPPPSPPSDSSSSRRRRGAAGATLVGDRALLQAVLGRISRASWRLLTWQT